MSDRIGLWIGSLQGDLAMVRDIALNSLLGAAVSWLPDQKRLLIRAIPERGPAPQAPAIPAGPGILEGAGASARSTYEARNLLETAHDDALFDYFAASELILYDPATGGKEMIGEPAPYVTADFSPDGNYLLVERLVGPWSHEVPWWRFATEIEVWNARGELAARIASLPVADQVPVHGVPLGPRSVSWRPTAPHQLFWVEALDGGNPVAKVAHRDRLMSLDAPFTEKPREVFRAEHRIEPWRNAWGESGGMLMLSQQERIRRWRYVWLLDVDKNTSRLWYDLDEDDRYGDPGVSAVPPAGQRPPGAAPEGRRGLFQRQRRQRSGRPALPGPAPPGQRQDRAPLPLRSQSATNTSWRSPGMMTISSCSRSRSGTCPTTSWPPWAGRSGRRRERAPGH